MTVYTRPTFDEIHTQILPGFGPPAPIQLYTALQRFLDRLEYHALVMRPHIVACEPPHPNVRFWFHPQVLITNEGTHTLDSYVVFVELAFDSKTQLVTVRVIRGHYVTEFGSKVKYTDYCESEYGIQGAVDAAFTHLRVLFGSPM